MARIAIIFGLLLIALGGGAYAFSESKSPTAFIPSGVGALLLICGLIALKDDLRKHAMHGAVLVGMVGLIGALVRLIPALINWSDQTNKLVVGSLAGMALLCGLFVVLCVKSFIDARKARRQKEAGV